MKGSFAGIMSMLTLPNGATSGARIVLDPITGEIVIYDANDNILIRLAGDTGILVPVPGDPTRYVEIKRTALNEPVVRIVSGDGVLSMGAGGGSPLILFADDSSSHIWEVGTNGDRWAIATTTPGNPSFSLIEETGITLRSSEVGNAVLFNNLNGFLHSGFVSPWAPENYTDMDLPAGWGTIEPCQYKIFPDGMVRLRGIVDASVSPIPDGTVLTTLPEYYRPTQTGFHPICFDASTTHGRALVYTTGVIELYECPNNMPALDSICFSSID